MVTKHIKRQHVISQVLLRRFADPGTRQVGVYSLASGSIKKSSPKSIGFVPDYVSHQPWAAEKLWQTVESRLTPAFTALDAGHAALAPEHLRAIADCVALHFSRSIQTRQIHEISFANIEQAVREDQHRLKHLALLKHGLHLDSPDILESIADEILEEIRLGNGSGELFQNWVEEIFQKTCSYLGSGRVTVHYCDDGVELVLGDSPSFGFRPGMQPTDRLPLYDSAAVLMPLGPRALVAIDWGSSKLPAAERVQQEHALYINRVQAVQAHDRVYYRPSSGLNSFVRKCRPPTARYPRVASEP
ncbi:DUF4238 domain-containing protein [Arthrobacter sp. FW306-06-A]|uniref:DUF4238 domain-containing protein n=1 Tax=Arthrobacter sp. FW306-06-A TaxID=2879621 RepID=UPI003FA42330|nr:DUF4238 domain-containing protein [Arthrobacter sp. FW306-06-A]